MANTIQLRRSALPNAVPTTAQLALGELAINTFDGKLYLKKNDGTDGIVLVNGAGGASGTLNDLTDTIITSAIEGNLLYYNGTNWVNDAVISGTVIALDSAIAPILRQTVTTEIKPISVGTTAPSTPNTFDLWVDTN